MKMLQTGIVAKAEALGDSGGRAVVVGVKLDTPSRELLTWALVKVAQPGDLVVALHVLGNDEIVDRDGKSSLLSLVKAFDSVLAVYEGFCNLKQVDLKLKISRGTSVRKILVREANSYSATMVIVGTARSHHKILSSTSVAKYCAKKLSKDCWVLAVNNGKVVFNKEGSPTTVDHLKGIEDSGRNILLSLIYGTLNKRSKALNEGSAHVSLKERFEEVSFRELEQGLAEAVLDSTTKCSICGPDSVLPDNSYGQSADSGDAGENNSLALVPVEKEEAASSPISLLINELPELKPGWPLLRRSVVKLRRRKWRNCSSVTETSNAPLSPEHSPRRLPEELEGLHEKYSSTCRLFKYRELVSATSNFLPENLVGKGGCSQVYRGCLPDDKELAVKILKPSEDVLKEFVLEIEIITTLHHKNIISLLGFCFEEGNLLLVYDFLSRGSLEENLHGNRKDPLAFGWSERYKVAVGISEALEYLHSGSARPVIHRDIKSSNILLSDDFEPQLCDFGLAKWASTTAPHIICTDVAGTFGYLAPEYFMYGKVNEKIDVYSFGVVLLELLSGRKPINNEYPKGQESLVMWAKPILNGGKVSQLLDPSLGNKYNQDQMERMVLAATLCLRRASRARPQMSLVSKLLHGDKEVTKWARLQVNASEESDMLDGEACPPSDLQSHLNLALLDVEDDSLSISSIEQSVSLEDYLQGRWSRSSSFD
ncbi:Receptor-like cytosolic serine/threonine-protein kinase RBK2 [Morella rubra]|uniref:Receptor-like cytosolic serine/threonine-protein kinase RBK2 n=1 Tax=Morella rubra TaxID=262757 RepID=A0A6A1UTT5_9ROSI|nr:Receptor-like cytosolic serine/threonine-protein kinase RBK2 [Morella rubra]